MADDRFARLAGGRRVVVCAGAGGVGKTTIAAAVSLAAAAQGKRVLCLTIDPARRLADSLGLSLDGGEEIDVSAARLSDLGFAVEGRLSVSMLDPKRTFDELVERHASTPAVAQRILQNQFYRHVSTSLAGTQSYMAMERVLSLLKSQRYDLIVLDTPPTAEALDFLDAPERLVDALDSPAMRWLVQAFEPSGRLSMRLIARGFAALLRTMGRLTGREFLEHMAEFVAELNELFGGFKERAAEVARAFRAPEFAYLLVAAPSQTALEEALFFAERLDSLGLQADALILNRVHREAERAPSLAEIEAELALRGLTELPPELVARAQQDELGRARAEASAWQKHAQSFAASGLSSPWIVPVMAGDVQGLVDLGKVSRSLGLLGRK
jgi:anion-transporting  ArsA/GET3 family ATPase